MDTNEINELNMFLEDIGFPTDRDGLVLEALESPLSSHIRDAIALLPAGDYLTREDVRRELIGLPDEDDGKKFESEEDLTEMKNEEEGFTGTETMEITEENESEAER